MSIKKFNIDELVKIPKTAYIVTPLENGTQSFQQLLDSGLRRNDGGATSNELKSLRRQVRFS